MKDLTDKDLTIDDKFNIVQMTINLWLKNLRCEVPKAKSATFRTCARGPDGDDAITRWALFPPFLPDKDILTILEEQNGWPRDGRGLNSFYDCTGQWFCGPPEIRRTPTRVLVTQRWLQDV